MSAWTWVLVGLCAAGAVLPLVPAVIALRLTVRIRSRVSELQRARLFTSLESLELRRARLLHIAGEARPLTQRAKVAIEGIRSSASDSGADRMRDAMQTAGAETAALLEALR